MMVIRMPHKNGLPVSKKLHWKIPFLICISLILLCGCYTEKNKVDRVGIVCSTDSLSSTIDGFKAKMNELGYNEGENIIYDVQIVRPDPMEETRVIEQFVSEKVDLIFAFPHDAALIAKNITQGTNIPVIFAFSVIDKNNFVNSLREPGGNVTGIQHPLDGLTLKRFELLLEFDPNIKRIWVSYDQSSTTNNTLQGLRNAAQSKNITLVEVPITTLDEMKADLEMREKMVDIGVDAILLVPDRLTQSPESWNTIKEFGQKHKLPISANVYEQIVDGALFHLGNDYIEVGEKAASLADSILKGTPPSELPVLSPEEYLRVNMVTAKALGLNVPEGLLKQAVEIIH